MTDRWWAALYIALFVGGLLLLTASWGWPT
jgi:hypothetical protein